MGFYELDSLSSSNRRRYIQLMEFVLIYSGALPPSGNSRKGSAKGPIREQISPQLKNLWDESPPLRVLKDRTTPRSNNVRNSQTWASCESDRDLSLAMPDNATDLCAPIRRADKLFVPLVRKSLDLQCSLDILFLRPQAPGHLLSQQGDLDNRVKTLLDGLAMPNADDCRTFPPSEEFTYCLLEDDCLVSRLNVRTDRLLMPVVNPAKDVHLVITVKVLVMKVHITNLSLVSS